MIYLYCGKKGTGKTKALINLANEKVKGSKGTLVYIDDDDKMAFNLNRNIRFISTDEYNLKTCDDFYGFLCGIASKDYDLENVFVDGLLNIVTSDIKAAEELLDKAEKLSKKNQFDIHINVSIKDSIPEFLQNYNCSIKE